jgi:hypothetical protein
MRSARPAWVCGSPQASGSRYCAGVDEPRALSDAEATALRRARWAAHVLDQALPLPFTERRVGLDGLLGLIPGVGDALGAALSSVVWVIAARAGVPAAVLVRMAANVGLELLVGAVPVLGDLFDFGWKANSRNADLMAEALAAPERARRASGAILVGLGIGVATVGAATAYGVWALLGAAWRALGL